MNRTVRGALIGGGVGALVAVAQTVRAEDDPPQVVAVQAAKGAAEGAVVGALVGWVLDRTSSAQRSGVAAYAEVARDTWESAVDTVGSAYEVARPAVNQLADLARQQAESLAEVARRRAA